MAKRDAFFSANKVNNMLLLQIKYDNFFPCITFANAVIKNLVQMTFIKIILMFRK